MGGSPAASLARLPHTVPAESSASPSPLQNLPSAPMFSLVADGTGGAGPSPSPLCCRATAAVLVLLLALGESAPPLGFPSFWFHLLLPSPPHAGLQLGFDQREQVLPCPCRALSLSIINQCSYHGRGADPPADDIACLLAEPSQCVRILLSEREKGRGQDYSFLPSRFSSHHNRRYIPCMSWVKVALEKHPL